MQDSPEAPSTGNKSPHSKRSRGHASPLAHGVLDGMDVDSAGQASAGDGASRSGVAELIHTGYVSIATNVYAITRARGELSEAGPRRHMHGAALCRVQDTIVCKKTTFT